MASDGQTATHEEPDQFFGAWDALGEVRSALAERSGHEGEVEKQAAGCRVRAAELEKSQVSIAGGLQGAGAAMCRPHHYEGHTEGKAFRAHEKCGLSRPNDFIQELACRVPRPCGCILLQGRRDIQWSSGRGARSRDGAG